MGKLNEELKTVLKLKVIEYDFIEDHLSNKSPWLLQYNPDHKKVPVFVHNGKAIAESLVIIEYIEETWKHGPSAFPKNPYEKAVARFWAKFFDEKCIPAMVKACSTAGEDLEKAKEQAIEQLKYLDNEIKGKRFFEEDTIGRKVETYIVEVKWRLGF